MTTPLDASITAPLPRGSRRDHVFPTLTPGQCERLAAHGHRRTIRAGEVLVETGATVIPFFAVVRGQIHIIRSSVDGDTIVAIHRPGEFTGEANMLSGRRSLVRAIAAVVGGGNSAGQAAVFLAQTARKVHMLVRSAGLADTMSRYLIRRIEENPVITLHTRTELVALEGDGRLERVVWRDHSGVAGTHAIARVFVMTGAVPNTAWLNGCVALDANGFVLTGTDLAADHLQRASSPLARAPHLLETSLPGVFAVGDVRAGHIKRVASAVGEGSIAVSFVHRTLQE